MENLEHSRRCFGLESNEIPAKYVRNLIARYRTLAACFSYAWLDMSYDSVFMYCRSVFCYKCMFNTSRGLTVRIFIVKVHSDNFLLERYILNRSQAWSEFIVNKVSLNSSLAYSQKVT